MNTPDATTPRLADQTDVLAEAETLRTQTKDLTAKVANLEASLAGVNVKLADAEARATTLFTERAFAQAQVVELQGTVKKLQDADADANARAAKIVAAVGLVGSQQKQAAATDPEKPLTLTQRVLAAKALERTPVAAVASN